MKVVNGNEANLFVIEKVRKGHHSKTPEIDNSFSSIFKNQIEKMPIARKSKTPAAPNVFETNKSKNGGNINFSN